MKISIHAHTEKGENTNVVDLSKKRCFHGRVGIDNEVICNRYIRRAV